MCKYWDGKGIKYNIFETFIRKILKLPAVEMVSQG